MSARKWLAVLTGVVAAFPAVYVWERSEELARMAMAFFAAVALLGAAGILATFPEERS